MDEEELPLDNKELTSKERDTKVSPLSDDKESIMQLKKKPKEVESIPLAEKTTLKKKPKGSKSSVDEAAQKVTPLEGGLGEKGKSEDLASESSLSLSAEKPEKIISKPEHEDDNKRTTDKKPPAKSKDLSKPEKPLSIEEKLAAKKTSKETKTEEPAFGGTKLKKSARVKREWKEDELETVQLKAHKFEVLPEQEGVRYIPYLVCML